MDDLNTNIRSIGGNRVLSGTDGDDLIDANANVFIPGGGAVQTLRGGQGADTIITSTNDVRTVVRLGLEDNLRVDDGDADTVRVNSTGGTVDIFDFDAGDDGGDRIDLSDTGITSFDQLNIADSGATDTRITADNLQTLIIRGDSDGVGIAGQADELNANDFIFAGAGGNQNNAAVVEATPEVEEVVVAPEIEVQAPVVEEVAEAPEVQQPQQQQAAPANLNVVDASNDNGGFQRVNGTDGDDLIISSANSASFVNAGAGDDTIILEGNGGLQTDFVNTGAGRDTVVLSDDTEFVTFSRGNFNTNEDVIDLSGVSGVNSFDDLANNLRDDLVAANEAAGALEISTGNGPTITFIDPNDAAGLSEDNFIFAGDDDAAVG